MAWFKSGQIRELEAKISDLEEKFNPAQVLIAGGEMTSSSRELTFNYRKQYESMEVVNRGVNMIVDDAADIPCTIGDSRKGVTPVVKGVRQTTLNRLLNYEPNPFQDINTFKRNLITDFLIDGNIFIYFDGAHIYHLPADKIVIHSDSKTYISHYEFEGKIKYYPEEIIHIKDNSFYSLYRGTSRLRPATRTMTLLASMRAFQDNFFRNGAVPGLVIKSPNTLSEKIKERMLSSWAARYRPDAGGRRPLILDGGLEIDSITNVNFKTLDFEESVMNNEKIILKALGVPPILLDSGNNANLRPNQRLFYLETIIPIVRKMNHGLGRFFGYEIWEDTTDTPALQPELKEQASYLSTLVNTGVITPNEARFIIGKEPIEGHDQLRIPANIAGSAANPSEGGRPDEGEENNK